MALGLGAFVGMVDATIVAVALDPIGRHFGVSLAQSQYVLGVYLVTVTATIPTLGRLGDRFGRRNAYAAGFVVFAAGSVLAALAPMFGVLLLARAIQAVGGGLLTAGSLALIAEHVPRRRTGRSVAVMVVLQAVAGLTGPPLGGLLVALWGWQAVFWAGVPLAALGLVLVRVAVPGSVQRAVAGLDMAGALALALLLLCLGGGIASLSGSAVLGWPAGGWLGLAAGAAGALLLAERRAAHPLLDRRLLRSGRFAGAALGTFLSTGTLMSCFAFLPYWLESAHRTSAAIAGAAFLPIGIGVVATARQGGGLGDLGRTVAATTAGMWLAAAGLLAAASGAALDLWPLLAAGLFALGAGNGLFSSPNTAAALAAAPRSALGSAAGFLSAARNAGVVTGLAVTGAVYTAAVGHSPGDADGAAAAIFAVAALICAAVALLARRVYGGQPARLAPAFRGAAAAEVGAEAAALAASGD